MVADQSSEFGRLRLPDGMALRDAADKAGPEVCPPSVSHDTSPTNLTGGTGEVREFRFGGRVGRLLLVVRLRCESAGQIKPTASVNPSRRVEFNYPRQSVKEKVAGLTNSDRLNHMRRVFLLSRACDWHLVAEILSALRDKLP